MHACVIHRFIVLSSVSASSRRVIEIWLVNQAPTADSTLTRFQREIEQQPTVIKARL